MARKRPPLPQQVTSAPIPPILPKLDAAAKCLQPVVRRAANWCTGWRVFKAAPVVELRDADTWLAWEKHIRAKGMIDHVHQRFHLLHRVVRQEGANLVVLNLAERALERNRVGIVQGIKEGNQHCSKALDEFDLSEFLTAQLWHVWGCGRLEEERTALSELLAAHGLTMEQADRLWTRDMISEACERLGVSTEDVYGYLRVNRPEEEEETAEEVNAEQPANVEQSGSNPTSDLSRGEFKVLKAILRSQEPLIAKEVKSKSGVRIDRIKHILQPGEKLRQRGLVKRTSSGYAPGPASTTLPQHFFDT